MRELEYTLVFVDEDQSRFRGLKGKGAMASRPALHFTDDTCIDGELEIPHCHSYPELQTFIPEYPLLTAGILCL